MTRKFQTEQPAGLTLKLFLTALDGGLAGEEEGYELTETDPRLYNYALTEPTMFGLYRGVIVMIVDTEEIEIDSGYVRFGAEAGNYALSNAVPPPITPAPVGPTEYAQYGPRRVKTKEMEIEQFAPDVIQKVNSRAAAKIPSFCSLPSCVGKHRCEE